MKTEESLSNQTLEVIKGNQYAIINHGRGLDIEEAEAYYRRAGMIVERHAHHSSVFDWSYQVVKGETTEETK